MKPSQIFILFIIGIILILFGVVFKLMDYPFASLLLIVGMTFEATAILTMLFKMIKK